MALTFPLPQGKNGEINLDDPVDSAVAINALHGPMIPLARVRKRDGMEEFFTAFHAVFAGLLINVNNCNSFTNLCRGPEQVRLYPQSANG